MSWRNRSAVLAFAIRSRLSPAGKVEVLPAPAGLSPRLSRPIDCATSEPSGKALTAAMSKRQGEIDLLPFIPARSPICRTADIALLFSIAAFGLAAAVLALARQLA